MKRTILIIGIALLITICVIDIVIYFGVQIDEMRMIMHEFYLIIELIIALSLLSSIIIYWNDVKVRYACLLIFLSAVLILSCSGKYINPW